VNLDRAGASAARREPWVSSTTSPPGASTSASARSSAIGSVTRWRIPKQRNVEELAPAHARPARPCARYSTRDVRSPAIARKPTPPGSVTTEASSQPVDVLFSLSTATTRRAPRASARRTVEAVECADVKHTAPRKAIRAEHREADSRGRVRSPACRPPAQARRCETKAEPNRGRARRQPPVRDGLQVGDKALRKGRLRDRFDRLSSDRLTHRSLRSACHRAGLG